MSTPVRVRVFDPAMCCSTGVCGPSVDPDLARFAADLAWLAEQGVTVERYNLSQQPGAFAETPAVREALGRGPEVLPLVLVDDRIAVEGAYPTRETLAALASDSYESSVEIRITALTSILEPLMIVIMGGAVGFIAFSILMPLIQMNDFNTGGP